MSGKSHRHARVRVSPSAQCLCLYCDSGGQQALRYCSGVPFLGFLRKCHLRSRPPALLERESHRRVAPRRAMHASFCFMRLRSLNLEQRSGHRNVEVEVRDGCFLAWPYPGAGECDGIAAGNARNTGTHFQCMQRWQRSQRRTSAVSKCIEVLR